MIPAEIAVSLDPQSTFLFLCYLLYVEKAQRRPRGRSRRKPKVRGKRT